MSLPTKPFSQWQKSDLNLLCQEPRAKESGRLDFKAMYMLLSDIPLAKEKARIDILKDIASFANAEGGALLIGVVEP